MLAALPHVASVGAGGEPLPMLRDTARVSVRWKCMRQQGLAAFGRTTKPAAVGLPFAEENQRQLVVPGSDRAPILPAAKSESAAGESGIDRLSPHPWYPGDMVY